MSGLAPEFDLLQRDWPVQAATDEPVRRTLNVTAPFNGEVIAQVAVAGERHVQDALFAAFSMFRQKDRWLSADRRVSVLERACELIRDNSTLLAQEAARESGKPLCWCVLEVTRVLECARTAVEAIHADSGDELPSGPVSGLQSDSSDATFDIPEPLGVVVAVLARNSPLELSARALFSALAAGCPVIVKPAEDTPLSCLRIVQVLHEAGLPYVWCQSVVTETHELTAQLVTDPRVALFSFCGSADVGWSLRSRLPPGTRCLLDHGCVAPAIVASDADVQSAVEAIACDGLMQRSVAGESIQRVFVLRELSETFATALALRAAQIRFGDPLQSETELGVLVREEAVKRVQRWVAGAVDGGAQLLYGGDRFGLSGYTPTVLLNPPIDSEVSTQPAGAPLVAIYAVDNLDEACDRANALPLARSAVVFSSSSNLITKLFRRLDATDVVVNAQLGERPETQSAIGLRRSGLGGSGVKAMVSAMQIRKSMVLPVWIEG